MKQRIVDKEAVKKSVTRSRKASAQLERRMVTSGFARSEQARQYLAERRQHA